MRINQNKTISHGLFVKPAEIAAILYDLGAIKFGDFTLSSGKHSPYYVDMRSVLGSPAPFRQVIGSLLDLAEEKIGLDSFDSIASVPTGGLVFASALAYESVKPLAYVRSSAKDHGTQRAVEGAASTGQRVLVVDDVATTGASVVHAVDALQKAGARVADALVVIDRLEGAAESLEKLGVRLCSVATIAELGTELHKQEKIDDATISAIRARTGTA